MSYVRIDTEIGRNLKLMRVSFEAKWAFVLGLCYCQNARTDGFIHEAMLPALGVTQFTPAIAEELVSVGCWDVVPNGWLVHDYFDWNDSAEERAAKTRFARDRKQKSRDRLRALKTGHLIVETQPEPKRISGGDSDATYSVPQVKPEPVPAPIERGRPLVDSPVRQMAVDARYGFMGPRFRVPMAFHQELVGRYGGDIAEAEIALQKWYRGLEASLLQGESIPNIYQFINGHFATWVAKRGAAVPSAPAAKRGDDQRQGVTPDFREQLDAAQARKAAQ